MESVAGTSLQKTLNISEMLDRRENAVRSLLLDELVRSPISLPAGLIDQIGARLTFSIGEVVDRLDAKGVLIRDESGAVTAVYPVSSAPTRHRVLLADGRALHAMCAIDAMGAAFAFSQDATVESSCLHCDTPVRLLLSGGRLQTAEPRNVHVLHTDLRRYRNWAADC